MTQILVFCQASGTNNRIFESDPVYMTEEQIPGLSRKNHDSWHM